MNLIYSLTLVGVSYKIENISYKFNDDSKTKRTISTLTIVIINNNTVTRNQELLD